MNNLVIIFPHQLFAQHPAIAKGSEVLLVEEHLYFEQYAFHKIKLAYHRATMQYYASYLQTEFGCVVYYLAAAHQHADARRLGDYCKQHHFTQVHVCELSDYWLNKRLRQSMQAAAVDITWYSSELFINTADELSTYYNSVKRLHQTDFYIAQRKQRNILLTKEGTALGGSWTYDVDNRKKYPKNKQAPSIKFGKPNQYVQEAVQYVHERYKGNPGECSADFFYATSHKEAASFLQQFLQQRLQDFGDFEDAIVSSENFLHHSVLTPMLNIGLLTPKQVLQATMAHYAAHSMLPLNSVEGFTRQILGWREFMRLIYVFKGAESRSKNFWQFTRKIPASFYNGTTGIAPVDDVIRKVLATGYCHHIERLMVLGNFMLLCEFDPKEVYRWFMELFIDAYDWVMVPNVYGMSQFADGGLFATKPYISGSNYIMKMSNYAKGDWQQTWDALFWHFMNKQRNFFLSNPRLGMLVHTFDKMDDAKKTAHLTHASEFLSTLD